MSDTLPFGIPFSRQELERAYQIIVSPEAARTEVRRLLSAADEATGVTLMDGTLFLLAALSDEVAERVIAYRPRLAESVRAIRADPEAFFGYGPPDVE